MRALIRSCILIIIVLNLTGCNDPEALRNQLSQAIGKPVEMADTIAYDSCAKKQLDDLVYEYVNMTNEERAELQKKFRNYRLVQIAPSQTIATYDTERYMLVSDYQWSEPSGKSKWTWKDIDDIYFIRFPSDPGPTRVVRGSKLLIQPQQALYSTTTLVYGARAQENFDYVTSNPDTSVKQRRFHQAMFNGSIEFLEKNPGLKRTRCGQSASLRNL